MNCPVLLDSERSQWSNPAGDTYEASQATLHYVWGNVCSTSSWVFNHIVPNNFYLYPDLIIKICHLFGMV